MAQMTLAELIALIPAEMLQCKLTLIEGFDEGARNKFMDRPNKAWQAETVSKMGRFFSARVKEANYDMVHKDVWKA